MKSFLKYLWHGKKRIVPGKVIQAFKSFFGSSINIEWEKVHNEFEAIFYYEGIEQIARFSKNGNLISLKKNLTINNIPEKIAMVAKSFGEVMNVIETKIGEKLNFEIIYRNESLTRFTLLLDEDGTVLSHEVL